MCGIAGFIATRPGRGMAAEVLCAIRDRMAPRGPDGAGLWLSPEGQIGLAHRRLSIIAVGDEGAQPMHRAADGLTLCYNGEIYNYRELGEELKAAGHSLATHSDSEVILALYAAEGVAGFARLRGMFAFAIWDERRRQLVLARDPYGIKPLYLHRGAGRISFASQVRALTADPELPREADPAALAGFAIWGSVPEPFTIFRSVEALPAGTALTIGADGGEQPHRFASIAAIMAAHEGDAPGDAAAAFADTIRAHLVADVEVGCFLSAGVDSGAIAGLMRDAGADHVRAVTLGFAEFAGTPSDEAPLAAQTAARYGIDHRVEVVTGEEFAGFRAQILAAMDQPSVDGVNTWLVARAAHNIGLKVALSGLGGDELLAGYSTFRTVPQTMRFDWLHHVPGAGAALGLAARGKAKARYMPSYANSTVRAYMLRRSMMLPEQIEQLLPPDVAREGLERLDPAARLEAELAGGPTGEVSRIALLESVQYMRNQLLRDSDWAGMAHSLEIRVPLVDSVLLARMTPWQKALSGPGTGKQLLGAAPRLPLPDAIVHRPKTGFQVPVAQWTTQSGEVLQRGSTGWAKQVLADWARDAGMGL